MANSLVLFIISLAVLAATALWVWLSLKAEIRATGRQIHRCAVHQRELLQVVENHRLLQQVQQVSESLVDEGTALVRTIHKEIANIPFEILESIPSTRDTSRVVRGVHDVTSSSIYAGIATANKMLGRSLRKKMRVSDLEEIAPEKEILPIKPDAIEGKSAE
ncbi:MAG: hypothetical protein ACPHER_08540 [Nevskiales bacterium]